MVDIQLLKSKGGSEEELKAKFTAERLDPKVKELIDLNATRIDEGIERNVRDARLWYAIDKSFDVCQRQITYTLVEGLMSKGLSGDEVMRAMDSWGLTKSLSSMVSPLCNSDGTVKCGPDGKPVMKLDLPTFFHIFIPLVQAYTKMRWAKLFGDRDIYPLYKYEPVSMTQQNRLRCEIITSRIQRMAQEMGYREDERQSILQMLKYGVCINFPSEDWFTEKQLFLEDGKEVERVMREGVRFEIPHPSRFYYDLNHRLSTANSDTGMEYAGFWNVIRYRELANSKLWNTDNVSFRYGSWVESQYKLFRELNPCMLKFPKVDIAANPGAGDGDRLREAHKYTTNHNDEGVTMVSHFSKVVPKEWNLFDYSHPVWMRFVHVGSHTVAHACPLAYNPLVAYMYDADLGSARPSSLSLELLPFQDHLSNLLTQYLLTVKQNMERVVFWNSDLIDQKHIDVLNNLGEKKLRGVTYIPFSKRELSWQNQSERDAFTTVSLPRGESREIASAINNMLSMMERVLGYSPQEVGSPAAHEQTAQEVQIIAANTSNRLELTGSFVDTAIKAKKRLLYEAMMAYSSDEVFADVAEVDEHKKKVISDIGFTVEEPEARGTKAGIKGDKTNLRVDGFASDREGADRIVDAKIAAVMIQTFQSIFANPTLAQSAGMGQLVDLFNQILVYAGAPKDFRLRVDQSQQPGSPQAEEQQKAQAEAIQQQLANLAGRIVDGKIVELGEAIKGNIVQPMQEALKQTAEQIASIAARQTDQGEALVKLFKIISSANAGNQLSQPVTGGVDAPQGMAPELAVPLPPQVPVG
jgi:hypothetical protein